MTNATIKLIGGVCETPTKKYPNGRTGTSAGYDAHIRAREESCESCSIARRERHKRWRDSLDGESREKYLEQSRAAANKYRKSNLETSKKSAARMVKIRQEKIRRIKESSPCMDCGKHFPYFVMQFDHVRGEKVSKISSWAVNNGWDRVKAEIAKCDLVCGNCHSERTQYRMGEERSYARPRSIRNRELIRDAKSVPCSDCNVRFPYYVMQFDHVRGVKKFNIGALGVNSKTADLIEEIKKCEVVCCNCHSSRTHSRLEK